jgi:hypothetical protein
MRTKSARRMFRLFTVAVLAAYGIIPTGVYARGKKEGVSPDDPTYRLFQLLDDSYSGKLTDFYLVADVYGDPNQPGQMLQHVLLVNYDKSRFFGRLSIHVRGVSQLTPEQLKDYTPAQIYNFGSDVEEFEKIDPGPFDENGDLYFRATDNRPLTPVAITDEARNEYETLLTRYILPALEKANAPTP